MGKVAEVGAWELEGRMQPSVLGAGGGGGLSLSGERAGGTGRGPERSVRQGQGIQALRVPPPRERASLTTGKVPSQTALMSHGSRDQAVRRHVQQKRAAVLVHFPKLSVASAHSALGKPLLTTGFARQAWESELWALVQAFLTA